MAFPGHDQHAQFAGETNQWWNTGEGNQRDGESCMQPLDPFEITTPYQSRDLTGYWEDGAVSSARENVMTRASAARLVQAAEPVS